ncbi:MFS transporter [Polaromonas sp. JS666]|uniref:MFS transporter n=1 Tax=Polaromonas sp. (strain JS666 / ATCC BAA-500) TaxID=296591 RepID=UPI0000D5B3C7|nr:MFS transporter [Polaromonas sp. JS666]ABE43992.1 major facilitator superfamily MFS_1 [Polaromonas sp. JS666]
MKLNNRWWIVVGSVFGLLVGNGPIMQFTFGVFLLPLTKEFGWSRSTTSFALVIGLTMTALFVPVAGRLIDRFGIRAVTLPAITLFSLSMAALAVFADTPSKFMLIYALMGIAAAGQTPLPYAKAIAAWFDDKRGLALGVAMSGVGLGAALVPQFAQMLVANVGWKGAYLGLAALTFVVGVCAVGLAVREPGKDHRSQAGAGNLPGLTGRQALRSSVFWKLAISFAAVAFATNGVIAHVVPMLVDRGVGPSVATTALGFAGLALIGGRLLAGFLLDRIFAPHVAAFFFAIPLIGIGILFSNVAPGYAAVAVVMVGLGLGAEVDLIAFLLSRYLGLRSFGEIYGYLFAAFMLGSGAGPYMMGFVFDATGSYTAALAGLSGVLVIACLLLLSLGKYMYPQKESLNNGPSGLSVAPQG